MPHVPSPVAISASASTSAEKPMMGGHWPSSSENDLPAEVIKERGPRRGALKQTFYERHGPNGELVQVPLTRNPARPGGGAIDNISEKPSISWNPKCPLKRITISPNPEWQSHERNVKLQQLQPPERSHITGTKKARIMGQKSSSSSSGNRAAPIDARDRDRSILRLLDS